MGTIVARVEDNVRRRFTLLLAAVAFLSIECGCGESSIEKALNKMMAETKSQSSAAEIRAAALPLFSYGSSNAIPISALPREITSLPIFAPEGASDMYVGRVRGDSNALMFITGSGFGHWGMVVCQTEDDRKVRADFGKRLIPWEHGVYFYRE